MQLTLEIDKQKHKFESEYQYGCKWDKNNGSIIYLFHFQSLDFEALSILNKNIGKEVVLITPHLIYNSILEVNSGNKMYYVTEKLK